MWSLENDWSLIETIQKELAVERILLCLVLCILFIVPASTFGSDGIDVHGWAHAVCDDSIDSTTGSFRFRLLYKGEHGLGGYVDLDLLNLKGQGGVKRALVSYNITPEWQIRVGRFPTTPFYLLGPSDIVLETVQYGRSPFSFYATGVQSSYSFGNGTSLLVDITGDSTKRVWDGTQFDRLETSVRFVHRVTGSVSLAETIQISEDFTRVGLDVSNPTSAQTPFRVVVYSTDENGSQIYGGYAMMGRKIRPWFEPHVQVDVQHRNDSWNPLVTLGVRANIAGGHAITLDYQRFTEQETSRVLVRVQARWK